ncbi:WD40 repeat-like protein [Suillus weaverae]|nr:WD40 repeat-like protein [Suillus weaverae]
MIALSPDEKKVVSGTGHDMKLWDIDIGKVIAKWTGRRDKVMPVCWSRDGRRVVSGSFDGTARQWDVENGQETSAIKPRQKFEGHIDTVNTIIHLPDGQRMMTRSFDGSLRVWNLKSGKQIGDEWRDGDSIMSTIALSPDGKKVVSGSENGGVMLWDVDIGKVVKKLTGHTIAVGSVCWSRDGRRVLSGSKNGTAREWEVENGETNLGPIETGHTCMHAIVYSPDMTMFATTGYHQLRGLDKYEDSVKIWDTKTGELVAILKGHTDMVYYGCLAWTPDGKKHLSPGHSINQSGNGVQRRGSRSHC